MSEYDRITNPVTRSYFIAYNDDDPVPHFGRVDPGHVVATAKTHVQHVVNPQEYVWLLESASLLHGAPEMPPVGEWVNEHMVYNYSGSAIIVYQTHRRQSDWDPNNTPALYGKAKAPFDEYVQPLGAHDAYRIGDGITFNGQKYRSLINANVWSPAAYPQGWEMI